MHHVCHFTKIKKDARVFCKIRSQITKRSFSNADDRTKLESVGNALNITDLSDWYSVSNSNLQLMGLPSYLVEKHANSPIQFFSSIYPEYDWLPWKFNRVPEKFWDNTENQRKYLDWLAIQLKITSLDDWYNVTSKEIYDLGGSSLLNKFNGSPPLLITSVYSERQWLPWKFATVPKGFWEDEKNQKEFIEWAGKQLGIKEMSDWYKTTQKTFFDLGGRGLLFKYGGSPSGTLKALFPEYEWLPWRFTQCPKGYWEDIKNHRKFLDWVAKQLNFNTMEDWYKLTQKDIHDLGGGGLLNLTYKGSPVLLLSAVFPDFEWQPWRFSFSPKYTWEDENNVKGFFEWAGKQLGIKNLKEWAEVSKKDIVELGGGRLLEKSVHSLSKLLSQAFPNVYWGPAEQTTFHKKSQGLLSGHFKKMFPKEEILFDYRHPDIVLTSGYPSELDIYFPNLKLAIEYQGEQHFKLLNFLNNTASLEDRKLMDAQKEALCKRKGITLLQIPYWWDRQYSSLAMTLYRIRPDLFSYEPLGTPIPLSPDQKNLKVSHKPKHFQFTLARNWEDSQDPTGWFMSEKFDGMRLYWDGSKFITRQNTVVTAPEFITKSLPKVPLDGELWHKNAVTQYGLYQEAVALSQGNISEEKWKKATFCIFDAPGLANEPFEERVAYLNSLENLPSFVKIVLQTPCNGRQHLEEYFAEVLAKGGEGVMLREPGSLYQPGRCKSLRKYKHYFDAEVLVTENKYPQGFECTYPNGSSLFVPVNENYDEAKKVKPGTVITVKHSGTNVHGNFLFPKFFRARTDVKWDDVIKAK